MIGWRTVWTDGEVDIWVGGKMDEYISVTDEWLGQWVIGCMNR